MKNLFTTSMQHFRPLSIPGSASSGNGKMTFTGMTLILPILLSVSLLILPKLSKAQAPQQFSFQGVARDAAGKILANKNITLELAIHEGSANGPQAFSEVHNTSTNPNGIFNLQIGSVNSLDNVNWGSSSYFLQIAIAYDGQPNVSLGTTQLLSVPYSLHATKSAESQKWVNEEPVIQTGSSNTGSLLPDVSNGNTLIWYPKNAAFRVGHNTGNKWNRTTIGIASFATGSGTLASGENSASFGKLTEATGFEAFAVGNGSKALGNHAFAAGQDANATGTISTAIGKNTEATGSEAFAVGTDSKATNVGSIAIGQSAESSGGDAIALGPNSKAIGANALAFGDGSEANGTKSIAFGNSVASGVRSFTQGEGTLAKAVDGVTIGTYNNSADSPGSQSTATDRLFQLGHGTSAARSNALTVLRNGNIGIGNNVTSPEFIMDFGGRPRVRNTANMTAGLYLDDSQGNADNFVGMITDDQIGFFLNNGWRFWVNNDNAFVKGSLVQTSDQRLKKDLTPLKHGINKIKSLQGYFYKWLDPKREQSIQTGLMAQEVEKLFPELVATDKDGYKAVNYIGLIPHLIEAVKELDKRTEEVAALKKELAEVKEINKRVMALEAGLKSLLTENKSAIGKSQAK